MCVLSKLMTFSVLNSAPSRHSRLRAVAASLAARLATTPWGSVPTHRGGDQEGQPVPRVAPSHGRRAVRQAPQGVPHDQGWAGDGTHTVPVWDHPPSYGRPCHALFGKFTIPLVLLPCVPATDTCSRCWAMLRGIATSARPSLNGSRLTSAESHGPARSRVWWFGECRRQTFVFGS
eukprot:COSAG06_NODE_440_length_15762_cov_75.979825_16_plen_176_part_00